MNLPINEGQRPSRLELDRYHTGELTPSEAEALEGRLGDPEHAHLAEVASAKQHVRPFDAAALRARAMAGGTSLQAAPATPAPANRPSWLWVAPLLLAAAVLLAVLVPWGEGTGTVAPSDPAIPDIRFRGGDVQLFVADRGALAPWDGEALGEGEVVGFRVDATGHDHVVIVSIDGEGHATVLWPEGDALFEPLRGEGQVPLPGTLTLDDAVGPETFLAIYDTPAPDALARARHVHRQEGAEGLLRWAEAEALVDAVQVERQGARAGTLDP
jgi:hypothetical protein